MKNKVSNIILSLFLAPFGTLAYGQEAIQNHILTTQSEELVLIEEVLIEAPVSKVWKAYTTAEGMTAWSAPLVEVDLRAGGSIRSQYDTNSEIGDPGTIHLRIVNYVPERLLTLQAEQAESWPEVMKQDAGHLMNIIVFESLNENQTKLFSYGVGYRDLPEYREMMNFFIPANAGLYTQLKRYVE